MEIIQYIIFVIFSVFMGFFEAYLDLVNDEFPEVRKLWNKYKHSIYIIPRVSVMIGLSLTDLWLFIPLALSYPIFHDGVYYQAKNSISGKELYKDGFWGFNDGSAIMDFKLWQRISMFILSIIALIIIIWQH